MGGGPIRTDGRSEMKWNGMEWQAAAEAAAAHETFLLVLKQQARTQSLGAYSIEESAPGGKVKSAHKMSPQW